MTINGGQPHRVGYHGQRFLVTVKDKETGERRKIVYGEERPPVALLRSLETSPSWEDAQVHELANYRLDLNGNGYYWKRVGVDPPSVETKHRFYHAKACKDAPPTNDEIDRMFGLVTAH